jgi:hypothetical protein
MHDERQSHMGEMGIGERVRGRDEIDESIPEWERPNESHMECWGTNPAHRRGAVSVAAMRKNIREDCNCGCSCGPVGLA